MNSAQSHKLTVGVSGVWERLPDYSYMLNFSQTTVYPTLLVPDGYTPKQSMAEVNSRLSGGVFLQYVWRPLDLLSLTAGLRLDATQLPDVIKDPQTDEVTGVKGTRIVPSINPRIGIVFAPWPGWSIKALYGRAFRAPTMEELAESIPQNDFNQGRFEGNLGLEPATVDTVELGVEATVAMADTKVRLRGNGYFNNFSSPIMAVDTTGNIIPLQNRAKGVQVFGAEAELRFEVSSRAYTFLNYSYFRANDLSAPDGFQYLTDVPQYRLNWAAQIPIGKWLNFSVLAQAGAERRNNGRSTLEVLHHWQIPAYLLLGAQLRTELIADHVEVAVTAQNVTNFDLKDDVPRPDAGRLPGLLPREGLGAFVTVRGRL